MLSSPEAELATDNAGGYVVEVIIADGAPRSVVADFQKSFMLRLTPDKSHAYNG